jgi:hypothetical protein
MSRHPEDARRLIVAWGGNEDTFEDVFAGRIVRKREMPKPTSKSRPSSGKTETALLTGATQGSTLQMEVEMCWGYRPHAQGFMNKAIIECRRELFIAGIGGTTIASILNDPAVIRHLAERFVQAKGFSTTIVVLTDTEHHRMVEEGGRELPTKIMMGTRSLVKFAHELDELVAASHSRPLIKFFTYPREIEPRHFFLRADDTIFVGSYLSHAQGSYSYLMKLRDLGEGLYALFHREIEFLKKHVLPMELKSEKDPR